jgi:hypothetical protein
MDPFFSTHEHAVEFTTKNEEARVGHAASSLKMPTDSHASLQAPLNPRRTEEKESFAITSFKKRGPDYNS